MNRLSSILVASLILPLALYAQSPRGIEIVQKANGVYIYSYAETIDPIDPRKDFQSVRQVTDPEVIARLKKILKDNSNYDPQFKARCLPVWDAGIEFRAEQESRLYLFSFRCNTIKSVEENMFKDFTPQRGELYPLLRFEINDRTSLALPR
ncbi:MAG: hypothetical protein JNM27_16600 [Leptospirales bacterium]|nr:hypothetical protein [Leptospirales bacterium]